jgi:four helix bundle protein
MNKAVVDKSYDFSIRIIELNRYLSDEGKSFALSDRLLSSGANIGIYARSVRDGSAEDREKLKEALRCAEECEYLFDVRVTTGCMTEPQSKIIRADCAALKEMFAEQLDALG